MSQLTASVRGKDVLASNSRHPALLTALAALVWTIAALAQNTPPPKRVLTPEERAQGYSSHSLIAKPRADATPQELAAHEARTGVSLHRTAAPAGELRILEVAAGDSVLDRVERLRATGRYEFVELDLVMKADATPNDPRFLSGDQWALRNIGQSNGTAGADIRAEEGWEIQSSARDVVVAIIDSGILRTHEDLRENLWINPTENGAAGSNAVDDDGNGYVDDLNGINATVARGTADSGNPTDAVGHGTAVASVIGAVGNNGVGMSGVAWNVKLMSLRFLDSSGFGLVSDEIECIDYAIAKGAKLINASFGGASFSQSLYEALKRARDAGIIVVCSAGNDGDNADLSAHYPSGYLLENIIAVANTTRTDALSSSSAYGSGLVDLGAPGTSIFTASRSGDRNYDVVSGTSFSAPMVTGALALLKAKFPNENYRETINRLLRGVEAKSALAGKTATGGRLNLAGALRTNTTRPFNDDFAQRAVLTGEAVTARSVAQYSTREPNEPVHAGAAGNGSLWWTWTAPRSGAVTLDTSASNLDTLLAVYTGNALGTLTAVASNDNESASATTSKASFSAVAGTAYQIAVDSKAAAAGLVALRVNLLAGNDDFASARPVTGRSWSVKADNRSATREAGEPRIRNNTGGSSVWYRWVAPATRRYHIATFSTAFDTMLGIYTGAAVSALSEISAVTTGGDSNFTTSLAATTLSATAGTTYYLVVDSEVSATGASTKGEFTLSCTDSEWEFFGVGNIGTVAIATDGTIHGADYLGYLYAINADGSRKWRYTMTGYGTFSSPAVAPDGTVYVGDDFYYMHAVTPAGTRKWRAQLQGLVEASPAIAPDGTVYVRSEDGRLHALHPDSGAVKWSFRMGASTTATTYSSPVIAPDGTIYCAGGDSKLYAISPDGGQKWNYATDFIYSSPAIGADGTVYFGVVAPTRRLIALKPDGTLKWDFIAGDTVSSSPAIGIDGTIYFGCADKKLYALSPAGQLRWAFEAGDAIRNSSPIIASDGAIYIGCLDGKVYCVESADGTLRRSYATASEVRSAPVLNNGRLYITSWDYRLYSIEVGQVPASSAWPMHRQNLRRTARLVAPALAIGVQPRAQSAEVSETITFAVGAVGTAPLTYQWFFNGQPIAGATAPTYRVDPVTHANAGQYSARVTDSTGSLTSAAAALTVTTPLLPPAVFTAPLNQTAQAGSNITLSVAATGTTPMTYQWLRDGEPIAGATNSSLVVSTARVSDGGRYSVKLTNFAGSVTSNAAAITVNPVSRISNLSIRTQVGGRAGTLTVGLTIGGANATGAKPVLLRAIGPTLAAFGVTGALADPQLALMSGQTIIAENDDWAGDPQVAAMNTSVGAFNLASATSKDSAMARATAMGGYTVRIDGSGSSSSGIALAEVYDASPSDTFFITTPRLTNVSALAPVGTGGDVLIAGFSITGTTPKTVLVRGIGPTLAAFGVVGALVDPKLELYPSGGTTPIAVNDNWATAANPAQVATTAAGVGAFALATDSKDAVLLLTLEPGTYTAQISGAGNTTGTALVEVYEVP